MIVIMKGHKDRVDPHVAALRATQINAGSGALLVLRPDGEDHKIVHQIEKLLVGVPLPEDPPRDLNELPWKPNSMVIITGNPKILADFEDVLPGFTKFFGPVSEFDLK